MSMCNEGCLAFVERVVAEDEVVNRRVIEVGSQEGNGSARCYIESLGPAEYVGVDIVPGRGVDILCRAEELVSRFGPATFDVLISTELMEHVRDWREVIRNMKRVVKPGGVIVITTRSIGYPMHGAPFDFWRYQADDMRSMFADCDPIVIETDGPSQPGVFIKARKPEGFVEADLDDIHLYSVIHRRRATRITESQLQVIPVAWGLWKRVKNHLPDRLTERIERTAESRC